MKSGFIAVLVLLGASQALAAPPKLTGSWEAAHDSADDDRVSLVLKDMGKAEIISEYDISLPGQGKRRGRSTSFGSWTLKGNELMVTYAKITDRLRYSDHVSLRSVGEQGDAPALTPIGKPPANSKIGAAVLWKAPHDHRTKAAPPAANAEAPKAAEPAAAPAK